MDKQFREEFERRSDAGGDHQQTAIGLVSYQLVKSLFQQSQDARSMAESSINQLLALTALKHPLDQWVTDSLEEPIRHFTTTTALTNNKVIFLELPMGKIHNPTGNWVCATLIDDWILARLQWQESVGPKLVQQSPDRDGLCKQVMTEIFQAIADNIGWHHPISTAI